MPTVISGQLNNVIVQTFSAAEMNGVNRPFLAIVLDANPGRIAKIHGLDYGVNFNPADAGKIVLIAQIARAFKPNPDASIFEQIDDGGSGVAASRLIRPFFRAVLSAPFDKSENWTVPIPLEGEQDHTIALCIGLNAAMANEADFYLLARGEFAVGGRGPTPRKIA